MKGVRLRFAAGWTAAAVLVGALLLFLNSFVVSGVVSAVVSGQLAGIDSCEVSVGRAYLHPWKGLVCKDLAFSCPGSFSVRIPHVRCLFFPSFLNDRHVILPLELELIDPVVVIERSPDRPHPFAFMQQRSPRSGVLTPMVLSVSVRGGQVRIRDTLIQPAFVRDLEQVSARASFRPHQKVSLKAACALDSGGTTRVRADAVVDLHEGTLAGRVRATGIALQDTQAYLLPAGLVPSAGQVDLDADIFYRDRMVSLTARAQAGGCLLRYGPLSVRMNGTIRSRLRYRLDDRTCVFAGSARLRDSSVEGLKAFGPVSEMNGDLSFSNSRVFSEGLRSNVWGVPLEVKLMLVDFDNPVLSMGVVCSTDLGELQRVARDQYGWTVPAQLSGTALLSLNLVSRPFASDTADTIEGTLAVQEGTAAFSEGFSLQSVNGLLSFGGDRLTWKDARFAWKERRFRTAGELVHFLSPVVKADLSSEDLYLETAFSLRPGGIDVASCSGKFADSFFGLTGRVSTADPGRPVVHARGELKIQARDLERFMDQRLREKLRPRGRIDAHADITWTFDEPQDIRLHLLVSSPAVTVAGLQGENLFAEYSRSHGVIDVPHASCAFYGGRVSASGSLNTVAPQKPFWLTLQAVDVDVARLKADTPARDQDVSGLLTLNAALTGETAAKAGVQGSGNASIRGGRLWSLNLFKGVGRLIFSREFTDIVFRKGACSFSVDDAGVGTDDLVMESEISTVTGRMRVGFDSSLEGELAVRIHDEQVGLTGTFRDVTTALVSQSGRFGTIRVSGSWGQPRYSFRTAVGGILSGMKNAVAGRHPRGGVHDPVVDSALTLSQALEGIDPGCPQEIRDRLRLLDVFYHGFDGATHRGQILIDKDMAADVEALFRAAYEQGFPFESVVPLADPRFRRNGSWSDDLSMRLNNTSAFHYRRKTGNSALSSHAFGCAIDINPRLNPFVASGVVLPRGAAYEPSRPGTLTPDSGLVVLMKKLGWVWGGDWVDVKDYQHFENPSKCARISREVTEGNP